MAVLFAIDSNKSNLIPSEGVLENEIRGHLRSLLMVRHPDEWLKKMKSLSFESLGGISMGMMEVSCF